MAVTVRENFQISKGKRHKASIGIIFGQPGVGKTQLASQIDNALIADIEDGSDFLDVTRAKVTDYEGFLELLIWFGKQDEYDSLVIDSITALERLTVDYTIKTHNWGSIEEPGYGKGWSTYRQYMQRIMRGLEYNRTHCNKSIVLVGHSQVKSVNDPTQAQYERMEYQIDAKMQPLLTAIVDYCFYMRPQVRIVEDRGKTKTFNSGTRELITVDMGGALAKNRLSHLPDIIEFEGGKTQDEINEMYREFWKQMRVK